MKASLCLVSLIVLIQCSTKKNNNNPFLDESTYNIVCKSVDDLKSKKATVNDSIYYLFQHNDSLIIASLNVEKFKTTTNAVKKGFFKIGKDRIVIIEEINPNYPIFALKKPIKKFPDFVKRTNDKFDNDYLKGLIYKIEKKENTYIFKKIFQGNLTAVFFERSPYYVKRIYE